MSKSSCRTTVPVFLFLMEFVSSSSCDYRTWSIEPLWTSRPAGRWLNPAPTCSSSPTPATSMISECSLYSAPPPPPLLPPPYPLLYLWSVSASLPLYHPPTPTTTTTPTPRLTTCYVYDQWMQPFHCTSPPHPDSCRPPPPPATSVISECSLTTVPPPPNSCHPPLLCLWSVSAAFPLYQPTPPWLLPSTPAMSMISECSLSAIPAHPTLTPAIHPCYVYDQWVQPFRYTSPPHPDSCHPPLLCLWSVSAAFPLYPPTPPPAIHPCYVYDQWVQPFRCTTPPHLLPSTPAMSMISECSLSAVPPHPTSCHPPLLCLWSVSAAFPLYPPTPPPAIHPCYVYDQWVQPFRCTTPPHLLPSTPAMSMISECSLSAVPPHPTSCHPPLLCLWSVSAAFPLYPPTPPPAIHPCYVYDQWVQPFRCTTPPHLLLHLRSVSASFSLYHHHHPTPHFFFLLLPSTLPFAVSVMSLISATFALYPPPPFSNTCHPHAPSPCARLHLWSVSATFPLYHHHHPTAATHPSIHTHFWCHFCGQHMNFEKLPAQ